MVWVVFVTSLLWYRYKPINAEPYAASRRLGPAIFCYLQVTFINQSKLELLEVVNIIYNFYYLHSLPPDVRR